MPNNPLYPGYSEKKKGSDQSNPLYPGYYTGQPIPRRPQSKNFLKPVEFDFDTLTEGIDNAAEKVKHSPINFPRWLWERIVDDAKESLTASIKPSSVSVTELEDYAVEDLPGAVGMSLSLNPEDWKDPKKQAFKTLSSWTKTAIGLDPQNLAKPDFSDIENEARKKLWHAVLGFEEKDQSKEGSLSKLEVKASEALGERTRSFANVATKKSDPFNVNGINVDLHIPIPGKNAGYNVDPKKNIYKEPADNITNYENIQKANKLRDGALDKVIFSSAKAINTEIEARKSKIERDLKEGPKTQTERDRLRFLKNTLDKNADATLWFKFKTDTVGEMKYINDLLNDDGGIVENIEKAVININKEKQNTLFNPRDPKVWEEFTGKNGIFETIRNKQTGELGRLEQARALLSNGKITQKSFNEFEKIMRDQNSYLTNLESAINDIQKGNMSRSAIKRRLEAVRGRGGVRHTGGDIFQNSAQRKLIKSLSSDLSSNAKDAVGSVLNNEDLRSADLDFDGRKLIPVIERLRQERLTQATEEFFDAAWDGKLAERYLWNNRIKPQLNVFTPDTFISNTLKKTNTLGLLIGKDFDVKKRFPNNLLKQARWAKRHEYKFALELDDKFIEKWDIKGLKKSALLLAGGDHFKLIKSFNKFNFENPQDKILMRGLLNGSIDPLSAYALNEFKKRGIENLKEFSQGLKDQLETYKDKMAELAKELGITNLNDPEMQLELLRRLMEKDKKLPGGYGILRKYAGHLDKLYVKIDNLSKWFRGTKLGKFIGGYNNLKSLVAEKLATWITNLLGAAAATTGIMKVLWPVIKGFVKKVLEKTIDTAGKILKGLATADFDAIFDALSENTKKAMIGCVIIMIPPTLFVSFLIYLVVMLFGVTIPIADPTIKSDEIPFELNMALTFDLTYEQMLALGPAVLPDLNLSASEIAEFAYFIASHLERGTWGAFNASDIPFYYNDETKQVIIGGSKSVGVELFWCTWMVVKAYQSVDPSFPVELSSRSMVSVFDRNGQDGYSYKDREEINVNQINSGDVLFFSNPNDPTKGHVAIVYEVKGDSVITIESNSALVSYPIGTDDSGHLNRTTPYSTGLVLEGVGQYEGNK